MNSKPKFALAIVVGAALGGAAVHGLHAQGKPKAYSITETEVIDRAAQQVYTPLVQTAQKAAPGNARNFQTSGGRVIELEEPRPSALPSRNGTAPSKRKRSMAQRRSRTLSRSAARRSRQSGDTSSKPPK